jgi:hypothetical protein
MLGPSLTAIRRVRDFTRIQTNLVRERTDLVRERTDLVRKRTRVLQRLENCWGRRGYLGSGGQADGQVGDGDYAGADRRRTRPRKIADLAKGRCGTSGTQLAEALDSMSGSPHGVIAQMLLD